jgi:hypothetical protein
MAMSRGCRRNRGSSTICVTVSHSSPSRLKTSQYSVSTAFSLYGTPFLRR